MDFSSLDVKDLIIKTREENDPAFDELVSRYMPMLSKQVRKVSGGIEDGELFNEAVVTFHKAALTYDLDCNKASFGLYARTCVTNRLKDLLKEKSSRLDVGDLDVERVAVSPGIELFIERKESLERIMTLLRKYLTEYEYEVCCLKIKGYKTSEIAEQLGKNSKSVDNALNRMKKHLKEVRDTIDSILN